MARPKKEKYIRDLFEDNFAEKFFEHINKWTTKSLVKKFEENRKEYCRKLLDKRVHFVDAPMVYFTVIKDNEKFTLNKFKEILFQIEFRELLYLLFEYIEKICLFNSKENLECAQLLVKKHIGKSLNKSIDNFLTKNSDDFVFSVPSRNGIILTVISNVLYDLSNILEKQLNPKHRKERVSSNPNEKSTLYASEYEKLLHLYDVYKYFEKRCNDKIKNECKEFTKEDWIRYFTANYIEIDIDDEKLEFIITNSDLNRQKLGFKYLKETYNLDKNDQTLDKIIDRGKLKRAQRVTIKPTLMRVDSLLAKMNNYKSNSLEHYNSNIIMSLYDMEILFNGELNLVIERFK